jgi:hypothetical protein
MQPQEYHSMQTGYRKTEKGQSEIQQKTLGLSLKQRTLLLLCDGKRPQTELLQATAGIGCGTADLQTLLDLGCIEAFPLSSPRTNSAPTGATRANNGASQQTDVLSALARSGMPDIRIELPEEAWLGLNELPAAAAAPAPSSGWRSAKSLKFF